MYIYQHYPLISPLIYSTCIDWRVTTPPKQTNNAHPKLLLSCQGLWQETSGVKNSIKINYLKTKKLYTNYTGYTR